MKKFFSVLLVVAALTPATGQASWRGWVDGNMLYSDCKTDTFACLRFIQGVIDAHSFYRMAYLFTKGFCTPSNVSDQQLIDVVVEYLNKHPQGRHRSGVEQVHHALNGAFPCPKK